MKLNFPGLIIIIVLTVISPMLVFAQTNFAPNEIIIKFNDPETYTIDAEATACAFLENIKAAKAERWCVPDTLVVGGTQIVGIENIAAYFNSLNGVVAYAEPNYIHELDLTPNDPNYNQLWGMEQIQAPTAWEKQTGNNDIVVAVIDSGVDWAHPDLKDNIWQNMGEDADGDGSVLFWTGTQWIFDPDDENGIDDDGNGYVDDFVGWDFHNNDNDPRENSDHGTHVAGSIGATGNNEIGVTGVCWNTQIMALKFVGTIVDESGEIKMGGYTSNATEALDYAINNGAMISNNSYGRCGLGSGSSLEYEAITRALQNNHLFVTSAGNYKDNHPCQELDNDIIPQYPANYELDNIISVANTNLDDDLSASSHYGLTTVDLSAPGSDIYSTLPNNEYGINSGTSMASPHVTGAAALLLSECPTLDFQAIKDLLLNTTDSIPSLDGKCVTAGRLNVATAMQNVETYCNASLNHLYVDQDAIGNNDGSSWANAFNRLEDALAVIAVDGEIWVAEGIYHPSPTADPTVSFNIPHSLKLYGGFDGTESSLTQRDIENNETILSGDYNGDDEIIVNTDPLSLEFLNTNENANLILKLEGANLGSFVTIDGLTIANAQSSSAFAGMYFIADSSDLNLQVKNCIIKENRSNGGAGIRMVAKDNKRIICSIENSYFYHNSANSNFGGNGGGAIWAGTQASSTESYVEVNYLNNRFYQNHSEGRGGAVLNQGDIRAIYQNCIFDENYSVTSGTNFENTLETVEYHNCNFYKSDGDYASLMVNWFDYANNDVVMYNCIFSENGNSGNLKLRGNGFVLGNCIIEEDFDALTTDANGSTDLGNNLITPPLYTDAPNGNFKLASNSPAINTGNNDYVVATTDFTATTNRILQSTVDIGALESQHGLCFSNLDNPIDLGPDQSISCGEYITLSTSYPNIPYTLWDYEGEIIGTNVESVSINQPGLYTVFVMDSCDNIGIDSIFISQLVDCVWPGDMNADNIVNEFDFIHWGWTAGKTGTARSNASTQWVGQTSSDWISMTQSINDKHSDADGNGIVNLEDVAIIKSNYGASHSLSINNVNNFPSTDALMSLDANLSNTSLADGSLSIDISINQNATAVHGMAWQIDLEGLSPSSVSFEYQDSWLGTDADVEVFTFYSYAHNRIAIGLTRTDGQTFAGNGMVGQLVVEEESVDPWEEDLELNIQNATIIDGAGNAFALGNNGEQLMDGTNIAMEGFTLSAGWNLVSFDVLPNDSSIAKVFSNLIPNNLEVVTGYDNGALLYDPNGPTMLNTLSHINKGLGYWVKVAQDDTLSIEGLRIDLNYQKTMDAGWNLVAFPPNASYTPEIYFDEQIENDNLLYVIGFNDDTEIFTPNASSIDNTLQTMDNSKGYWVKLENAVSGKTEDDLNQTNVYDFINGTCNLEEGKTIEVYTIEGEFIGILEVLQDGHLMTIPIYGDDLLTEDKIEGVVMGETLVFKYNDEIIDPGLTFAANMVLHKVHLEFTQVGLNSILDQAVLLPIYPNPTQGLTHIKWNKPGEMPISITVYDLQGNLMLMQKVKANENILQLNLSNLVDGTYLYTVHTKTSVYSGKILKVQ